ncbi:breast cancer metastasis-suppressor 1-like protein isoform X2 [Bolinopsis microptera]|uniref:breast cancer metastasis-suppressor 1-like protein isoform X2 n=1 Tax=Bolinopsis microptera TaxID=2820187 RepID=UPI00307AE9A9
MTSKKEGGGGSAVDEDSSESHGSDSSCEQDDNSDDTMDQTRKKEAQFSMARIEKHFTDLKEQLYKDRISQVEKKIEEVKKGSAEEYLKPLRELTAEGEDKLLINETVKQLQCESVYNKFEAEKKSCKEQLEQDKLLLFNSVRDDIEDKITEVMNNRTPSNVDIDRWIENLGKRKKRTSGISHRKPVRVKGPYVVYMLTDQDIIEDINFVKQILHLKKERRRTREHLNSVSSNDMRQAKFEDGKLYYEGNWFAIGSSVYIDKIGSSPLYATISAINTGEVWVRRRDGSKTKLYISQLQRGKFLTDPVAAEHLAL